MPIDSSIYFQQQTPDILGSVQQGLSMRDMMQNRKMKQKAMADEDAKKKAYASAIVQNPDGTTTVDNEKAVGTLAGLGFGEDAMKLKSQGMADQASAQKMKTDRFAQHVDFFGRAINGIKDQDSYNTAIAEAKGLGLDVSAIEPMWGPKAQQQLNFYAGQAFSAKDRQDQEFKERELQSRAADRSESRNERRFQAGIKMDEKVQGLKTPFGLANTTDDAKQLKDAFESKQNFDSKLNEMISLREKYGVEYLNREAVARGKQLSKDLLLEYKNMAKLGVLSAADEDIINAIIPPDPLGQDGAPGQDPIMSNLKKFRDDKNKDFQTRVRTRTRGGIDGAAMGLDGGSRPQPQTVIQNGVTYKLNPQTGKYE